MSGKTKITITKDDGYMSIEVKGHNKNELTCAGISAIMQTCEAGLERLAYSVEDVILIEDNKKK